MAKSGRVVRSSDKDKAKLRLSSKRRKKGPKKKSRIIRTISQSSESELIDSDHESEAPDFPEIPGKISRNDSSTLPSANAVRSGLDNFGSHEQNSSKSQVMGEEENHTASVNSFSTVESNSSCGTYLERAKLCEEDLWKEMQLDDETDITEGTQTRDLLKETTKEQSRVPLNEENELAREKGQMTGLQEKSDGEIEAASISSISTFRSSSSYETYLKTAKLCEEDLYKDEVLDERNFFVNDLQTNDVSKGTNREQSKSPEDDSIKEEQTRVQMERDLSIPETDRRKRIPSNATDLKDPGGSRLNGKFYGSNSSTSFSLSGSSGSYTSFLARANITEDHLLMDIHEERYENCQDDQNERDEKEDSLKKKRKTHNNYREEVEMEYAERQSANNNANVQQQSKDDYVQVNTNSREVGHEGENDDNSIYTDEETLDDENVNEEYESYAAFNNYSHSDEEYADHDDMQDDIFDNWDEELENDFHGEQDYVDEEGLESEANNNFEGCGDNLHSDDRNMNNADAQNEENASTHENPSAEEAGSQTNSENINQPRRTRSVRNPFNPESRDIVKMYHVFKSIQDMVALGNHAPRNCGFLDLVYKEVKRDGFLTTYRFVCSKCPLQQEISSEPQDNNYLDVNRCFVLGIHNIGKAYAGLMELSANIGLHGMDNGRYQNFSVETDDYYYELAQEVMKRNGEEERRLAIEAGAIGDDGIPYTEVYGDGRWTVRTYGRKGCRSQCATAVLIGARSKKVLYADTKNKYCSVCQRALYQTCIAPEHRCYRNYPVDKSILSAEGDIIVEGFKRSIEDHGLRYTRYIGDGDSSTYNKLRNANVYDGIWIHRGLCILHIKRLRISEIMEIIKNFKPAARGFENKLQERQELKKIMETMPPRINKDVTSAANYWRQQVHIPRQQRISNIKEDLENLLYHVFGDHKKCHKYFCDGSDKPNEKNLVSLLEKNNVFDKLQLVMLNWASYGDDLERGQTTNLVESFNAEINKYTDQKATNYQQRGACPGRVCIAVVQQGTRAAGSEFHKKLEKIPPQTLLEWEASSRRKNENNKKYPRRRKMHVLNSDETENLTQSPDYGSRPQQPDLSPDAYQEAAQHHSNLLNQWQGNRVQVEERTRGGIHEEYLYRTKLLFSENFGVVCRRRRNTPTGPLVAKILYPPGKRAVNSQYQELRQYELKKDILGMRECGVFIDKDIPFLAAKPFGLIGDDTIVMMYTPYEISKNSIDEAIKKKKSDVSKLIKINEDGTMTVNQNNKYYYDIIGSLVITGKTYCQVVIAAGDGTAKFTVSRNDDLWKKMTGDLNKFYNDALLPEIIDSRYKRNMPLRDAGTPTTASHGSQPADIHEGPSFMENEDEERYSQDIPTQNSDATGTPATADLRSQPADIHEAPSFVDNENDELPLAKEAGDSQYTPASNNDGNHCRNFMTTRLEDRDYKILENNGLLEDTHIDVFGLILMRETNNLYEYRSVLLRQAPARIQPINPKKKHVQILHHPGRQHWVCAFWDTKKIFLYDSLPLSSGTDQASDGQLAECYRNYLSRLLPGYNFDNRNVVFPVIQHQQNGVDCGVFAIAVSLSLVYGLDPTRVQYDRSRMRSHLERIYRRGSLEHFPLVSTCKVNIPNLHEVLEKERTRR